MSRGLTVNNMRLRQTRGQRQYINPFKPKENPSENWAWGVGVCKYINPFKPKEYPSENWAFGIGERQYINPFKLKVYPSENRAWGVGEAIRQGKMRPYFSKVVSFSLN